MCENANSGGLGRPALLPDARGIAVRTMLRMSRGRSGKTVSVSIVLTLVLGLSCFMIGGPMVSPASGADPTVIRSMYPSAITIGDTITYTNTYTVPAGAYLRSPFLLDEYNNRGAYPVPGTAVLDEVPGNLGTPVSGAAFLTSSEPVRSNITSGTLWTFDYGASYRWDLADIDNTESAEPYVFTLTFDMLYTGVLPLGAQLQFPPGPSQRMASAASIQWDSVIEPVEMSPAALVSAVSNITRIDVDQPVLQLEKSAYPVDADYARGQDITYEMIVTNVGYSQAYDITVDDILPPGFDWDAATATIDRLSTGLPVPFSVVHDGDRTVTFDIIGSLAPFSAESFVIMIKGTVPESASAETILTNQADVDWSSRAGDVNGERVYNDADWEGDLWTADTDDAAILVANAPYIKLTKEYIGAQPPFQVGDEVVLDITLTNVGTAAAPSVGLDELFDDTRLRFVSASVDPDIIQSSNDAVIGIARASGTRLIWSDINGGEGLDAGHSWTVRVTYEALAAGYAESAASAVDNAMTEPAEIISPQALFGGSATLDIPIYDPADLVFVKGSDPTTDTVLLPGDTITYGIQAVNNTGIDLEDPACIEELPDSVDYVPGSMMVWVNGWDVELTDEDDGDGGTYDPATHTITFLGTGLYTFEADDEVLMTFDVVVGGLERSYFGVLNQAELQFGEQTAMYSNEVYHFVDPIEITKAGVDLNGGRLIPGDTIEWTITVLNVGLSQTTNVVISDSVPANTTYVAGSITGTGANDSAAPNLTWNIGVLPVDGTARVTFRTTVDEDVPAGTVISNQASVASDNSPVALSDDASTAPMGDATLLRTGGDEILMLAIAAVVLLIGSALVVKGRTVLRAETATVSE